MRCKFQVAIRYKPLVKTNIYIGIVFECASN